MRALFGVLGLMATLAIVAILAKKQLGALTATPPVVAASAPTGATIQQQSQQIQKQVAQSVETTLQQPRSLPDDK